MAEVLYNISGMRLPVVMTVANRAVSAPINIWNDHSDIMGLRDAGAILLFAENHQEAIDQHVVAYKVAEALALPVFINVDGYILTHSYESCEIPTSKIISKFLPKYKAKKGEFLDPKNPVTMGVFAGPKYYSDFRKDLQEDLLASAKMIDKEYANWKKIFPTNAKDKGVGIDTGLIEYYGPKNPKTVIVTLGSVAGTIKQVIDDAGPKNSTGLLKLRCYRPFPENAVRGALKGVKTVIALEKTYGLGYEAPLFLDLSATLFNEKIKLVSAVVGLGGQDVTEAQIAKIIKTYDKI
jgi:pyruvate ferredoxin oxidoreductase alpha subunit